MNILEKNHYLKRKNSCLSNDIALSKVEYSLKLTDASGYRAQGGFHSRLYLLYIYKRIGSVEII